MGEIASCADVSDLDGMERFNSILAELTAYSHAHFVTEEKILQKYGYTLMVEHKIEHQKYKVALGDFHLSEIGGTIDIGEVKRYLSNWWLHHILETDMTYKEFLLGLDEASTLSHLHDQPQID